MKEAYTIRMATRKWRGVCERDAKYEASMCTGEGFWLRGALLQWFAISSEGVIDNAMAAVVREERERKRCHKSPPVSLFGRKR